MKIEQISKLIDPATSTDDVLAILTELTESRIKTIIGTKDIPEALDYVIADVVLARYNTLGSDGVKSQGQEGFNQVMKDDFFDEHMDAIMAFKEDESRYGSERRGNVWFI